MRRLLVARFWFEGNRFASGITDAAAFARCEWVRGDDALNAAAGTEAELAAVVDFARTRSDWSVSVSRCAAAWPGGPVDDALFDALVAEIVADVRREAPDAVVLSLHGAAITVRRQAPDLELVQRVRAALGPKPLLASFDLHANLSPALVALLDFASAYRTYPHIDLRATAARVLARLDALCDGARPQGSLRKLGALLPSFRMRSDAAPMAPLLQFARALEAAHPGADLSILGGFPYADTAHADAGVMAWCDGAATACALADELLQRLRDAQQDFEPDLPPLAAGLSQAFTAMRHEARQPKPRPVAVTDPADNPLSGGSADTPGLLRALLGRHAEAGNAKDAETIRSGWVFAYFRDPDLVRRASEAGAGAELTLQLGALHSTAFGAPIIARGRVMRLASGRFINRGPMQHGLAVDAGPCALIDVQGIAVILTSAVVPANDPAFFEALGIDLQQVRLLCVKAKNHFHAAFAPLCAAIIEVDAPGPAMADLSRLPFVHWPAPSLPAPRA